MKKIMLVLLFAVVASTATIACDIKFKVTGTQKEVYKAGDEVIIEVTVTFTHHNCPIKAADSKFMYEGLKIESATQWKETQSGVWVRQLKAKILADSKPEAKLTLTRKCEKEGGYGVFKLKKQ